MKVNSLYTKNRAQKQKRSVRRSANASFPNRSFSTLFFRQLRQPVLQDGHTQVLSRAKRTVRRKPVDLDDCLHQLGYIFRSRRIPRGNRPDVFFPCYLHRRKIAAPEIPVPQMERRNQPLSRFFLPLPHRSHPLSTITNFCSRNLCSQNFCSYISIENLFCQ